MPGEYILRNKSAYVADSVLATYFAHDAEQVSLYPILDHVSLLFQRALDINVGIIRQGTTDLLFSNSTTKLLREDALKIMTAEDRHIECVQIASPSEGGNDQIFILVRSLEYGPSGFQCRQLPNHELEQLRNFFDELTGEGSLDIYRAFYRAKPRGIASPAPIKLARKSDQTLLMTTDIERLTGNLSRELDYLYQSLSATRGQMHRILKAKLVNVFCVARYVAAGTTVRQDRFPYDARIVLSRHQESVLDASPYFKAEAKEFGMEASALLQQPLGETSRSIADAIFQSGIIEFPIESFGQGRDSNLQGVSTSSIEEARRKLENRVLSGFGKRLMYVPVHVGGVPWAVFFVVLDGLNASKDWLWITRFYRACAQLLGDGLRRIVRRQFLDELGKIFEQEFKFYLGSKAPIDLTLGAINQKVRELCGFFPYVPPKLIKGRRGNLPWLSVDRGEQPNQISITSDDDNPFACFADGLAHDRLQESPDELLACLKSGYDRARVAQKTAKAVRAEFGGALAHDVKNATNEIISRLGAPLQVFRDPNIGSKYQIAQMHLSRAHVRAMMLNAIAVSLNVVFVDSDPLNRLGERSFPKADVETFWRSILRLLLEIRSVSDHDDEEAADPRTFGLVMADSLDSLAQYYDDCARGGGTIPAYPLAWDNKPSSDLNTLLAEALKAISHKGSLKNGLRDERLGIGFAMLSEIISNIRFDKRVADLEHSRDMIIGADFRWNGNTPELYLQQVHWEAEHGGYRPMTHVPQGIGRTLSVFGNRPGALNLMDVKIADHPVCRSGIAAPPGGPGLLCAYPLRISLGLLKGI